MKTQTGRQKIITVVGKSDSGKTTLIERLIEKYSAGGRKVSVVKSMRHHFDIDHPGKDTFRYREAGSTGTAITNGSSYAVMSHNSEDLSPLEIGLKSFPHADIIIIEGFKEGNTEKIEVIGDSPEPPLYLSDSTVKMIVTDRDISPGLPCYKRDDIEEIFSAIEKLF